MECRFYDVKSVERPGTSNETTQVFVKVNAMSSWSFVNSRDTRHGHDARCSVDKRVALRRFLEILQNKI